MYKIWAGLRDQQGVVKPLANEQTCGMFNTLGFKGQEERVPWNQSS